MTENEHLLAAVLMDIAAIVLLARAAGAFARRVGQPAVVGEMVGGIIVGIGLSAWTTNGPPDWLFPGQARPFLSVIAQLGLILFMFTVGLELDVALLRARSRTPVAISLASVTVPFLLGVPLASFLHGRHAVVEGRVIELVPFALFVGAAMCITAFPVLARILTEGGLCRTSVGTLVLASAAIDDVIAWVLLGVVLAVVTASGLGGVGATLFYLLVFLAVMALFVRPLLRRHIVERHERSRVLTPDVLVVVLVGLLISACLTAWMGLHAVFGAFVFGALFPRPHHSSLLPQIVERLEAVTMLLLPVFFVTTGLDVEITRLTASAVPEFALIMLVACAGKFCGAMGAGLLQGLPTRSSLVIGALMNTRGLTELVILDVGRTVGVLSPSLFALFVLMAILTTVMAAPVVRLLTTSQGLSAAMAPD